MLSYTAWTPRPTVSSQCPNPSAAVAPGPPGLLHKDAMIGRRKSKYFSDNCKPKPTFNCKNCSYVCISLCTTVVHNTAQNSSDNLLSYPPDNHHCSDTVQWREGAEKLAEQTDTCTTLTIIVQATLS